MGHEIAEDRRDIKQQRTCGTSNSTRTGETASSRGQAGTTAESDRRDIKQ